ncbi:MAG: MBL fold metallo-hydrolase [Nitrospirales bacterium]|nr:MBL fold metallo-hydrolase [Nitrospira sp.]MDR4500978.1 MBL fold metallo-hydrolase [Nitrospirales bacterium]
MQVTILGSGTNLHPRRAAAGYLVQTSQPFLIDFGPRTLTNLIKTGFNRHRLEYLLFTHYHADHFADFIPFFFDAVCHSQYTESRPDLTIIGPKGTKHLFRSILKTFPVFDQAPFRVRIKEVEARPFMIGTTRITPRVMTHTDKQTCLGYRVEYQGHCFAYSGDACYSPNLVQLCRDVDCAILDCSFPRNRPGAAHMHAGDCGKVAQEAGVKRLVLTHFYPVAERYDVKKQAARAFRGKISLARDLMKLKW